METQSDKHRAYGIYVWLPAIFCILAIVFREICQSIFSDLMSKKAEGQLIESPSWIGPLDTTSSFFVVIAVLAVILSGVLTKGWVKYPSWVRIILPVLGAATVLLGLML